MLLTVIFFAFNMSVHAETTTQDSVQIDQESLNQFKNTPSASTIDTGFLNQFKLNSSSSTSDNAINFSSVQENKDNVVDIKHYTKRMSTQASYDVSGYIINHNDSLTTADPADFYFFNVPNERSLLFKLASSNSQYKVQLYKIDWDAGQAYPTNINVGPGTQVNVSDLYAGDWGLRVFSEGSVGDSYTIKMNATNPGGFSNVLFTADSFMYTVLKYPNNDIYSNGVYVCNLTGENPHLDWNRWSHNSSENWNRTHNVDYVKILNISTPVNYSSEYASSNNAILIYLDKGTMFTYFFNGSFTDVLGRTTPRRLDDVDMMYGSHVLVYDLNTGKPIDFYSPLNFYYRSNIEPTPTVTNLN